MPNVKSELQQPTARQPSAYFVCTLIGNICWYVADLGISPDAKWIRIAYLRLFAVLVKETREESTICLKHISENVIS
jgi:hypothetical protein